jgi:hypothetical protein
MTQPAAAAGFEAAQHVDKESQGIGLMLDGLLGSV